VLNELGTVAGNAQFDLGLTALAEGLTTRLAKGIASGTASGVAGGTGA
jgi:hypothetical protein